MGLLLRASVARESGQAVDRVHQLNFSLGGIAGILRTGITRPWWGRDCLGRCWHDSVLLSHRARRLVFRETSES